MQDPLTTWIEQLMWVPFSQTRSNLAEPLQIWFCFNHVSSVWNWIERAQGTEKGMGTHQMGAFFLARFTSSIRAWLGENRFCNKVQTYPFDSWNQMHIQPALCTVVIHPYLKRWIKSYHIYFDPLSAMWQTITGWSWQEDVRQDVQNNY